MAQESNLRNTHLDVGEASMGYRDLSISKYVVAAICGCWWRESNVNSGIWESLIVKDWDYQYGTDGSNKGGYGFGQWTNTGTTHGRLYNLHTWVTTHGYTDGNPYGQLEYLLVEDHWARNSSPRLHYSSLTQFLQSTSTDTDDLVYDFLACWEGVEGDHYSERCGYASDILDYINVHQGETASFITGNRYLGRGEILNNALAVYNYMSRGSATGYPIYISSTGNGTASVVPDRVEVDQQFTVYATPNPPDEIVLIQGWTADGQSIAMGQGEVETYTYSQYYGDHISIDVEFSGETPPVPPTPTKKKMPLWMMIGRRKYIL